MNYLVQVNLFWLLLYGCYWLVLRRHTFFAWNRTYLLGSLLLAFALPLVPYPEGMLKLPDFLDFAPLTEAATLKIEAADPSVETYAVAPTNYAPEAAAPTTVAPALGWAEWLAIIYGLGVLFMAARLFRHLRGVYAFFYKSPCLDMDAYRLYLLDDDNIGTAPQSSFSFLNHIVITRRDYEENFDTVLNHELAHVRQRHSLDILGVEGLRVVFWFNPVLVFYKKSLQQVHEYLADREVCAWNATPEGTLTESTAPTPRDRYAAFMLSYATNTPGTVLTNQFFNSKLLKNRIAMLYKNKTSNWSLGKYAAVALLVGFASLTVASCERSIIPLSANDEAVKEDNIAVTGIIDSPDHKPLEGATITDSRSGKSTTADVTGKFGLKVPAGSDLKVSYPGLETLDLKIDPDKNAEYNIVLAPKDNRPRLIVYGPSQDGQTSNADVTAGEVNGKSTFTRIRVTPPAFPGGHEAMFDFLEKNVKYPAPAARANVSGKVFLVFTINTHGEVKDVEILRGLGFGTGQEVVRAFSKMPNWKPGMEAGRATDVRINIPIEFQLEDGSGRVNSSRESIRGVFTVTGYHKS